MSKIMNRDLGVQIGQRISDARKQRSLTQQDLADLLHLPKSTVGMWETGRNTASIDALIQISKVLKMPFDYFIGVENENILSIDGDSSKVFYRGKVIPQKYLKGIKAIMDDDIDNGRL